MSGMSMDMGTVPRRLAGIVRMPGVTEQMGSGDWWADKARTPDEVLATPEEIAETNALVLSDGGCAMNDLLGWTGGTYDGVAYGQSLMQAALDDCRCFYGMWARYDAGGAWHNDWEDAYESIYRPMVENAGDPDATTDMPILYGVGVTRTCVLSLPSFSHLLDDATDPDFDYQYQTMLRVNEPFVVNGRSADDQFFHVVTSCTQGWVAVTDAAICSGYDEWLDAWHSDDPCGFDLLVTYGDKVRTEASNYAPDTANRLLPMGTTLKLAAEEDWGGIRADTNRSGHNNHVVWMPVRNDDGSYARKLALVPEHASVSEGYLSLTTRTLMSVAMGYLGNAYGWGGMLESEDCSGYVRDVYKCFGYELPRNTTWQSAMPVNRYALGGLDDDSKREAISKLPAGTILFFNGHEMLYLGDDGDDLYVVSSISNACVNGIKTRVRGNVINTLDGVTRTSGNTWLQDIDMAVVPFRSVGYVDPVYSVTDGDGQGWVRGAGSLSVTFDREPDDGNALSHLTGILVDGQLLQRGTYGVAGGGIIVTLPPELLGTLPNGEHTLTATFDDGADATAMFTVSDPVLYRARIEQAGLGTARLDRETAPAGTSVTVTAQAHEGYKVSSVTAIYGDDSLPLRLDATGETTWGFTMPAGDVTVSVVFTQKGAQGDNGVSGGGNGQGGNATNGGGTGSPSDQGGKPAQRRQEGATSTPEKPADGGPTSGSALVKGPVATTPHDGETLVQTGDPSPLSAIIATFVVGFALLAIGIRMRGKRVT